MMDRSWGVRGEAGRGILAGFRGWSLAGCGLERGCVASWVLFSSS